MLYPPHNHQLHHPLCKHHAAEEAATMPHDSPLLRVHSLGSDEGMKKLEHKVKSSKARRTVKLFVSEDEDKLEDPSKYGRKIA
ncbi:hypothetical protein Tco_0778101 [Tanacetum coccineum]